MTGPNPDQTVETIRGAIATAPQLKIDALWLWTDAYWPPGRNPDRPTRAPARQRPAGDPDHVPGERLALGIGNDRARAAYTRSARLVVDAHRAAGRAVAALNGRRPPADTARRPARGPDYLAVVDRTVVRLRWLLDHDPPHDVGSWPDRLRHDAWTAANTLHAAHVELRSVLRDVDGTGEPDAAQRCQNPLGCSEPARGTGKECPACASYRLRKHRHRPPRRWAGEQAAARRREERGEAAAQNPPPAGRYMPAAGDPGQGVVWEPSTPHPDARPGRAS